jgi:hypothetical protein
VSRYQPHIDEPFGRLSVCDLHDVTFQRTQGKQSSFVGAVNIDKIAMQNGEEPPKCFLIIAEIFELNRGDCPVTSAFGNRFDLSATAAASGEEINDYRKKNERTDGNKRNSRHATDCILLKIPEWVKFHEMLSLTELNLFSCPARAR